MPYPIPALEQSPLEIRIEIAAALPHGEHRFVGLRRNALMKILLLVDPLPSAVFVEGLVHIQGVELLPYHRDLTDADLADVEVVLAWNVPEGVYSRLPRLRWVCSVAAGVEKLLAPDLPAHIPVSRIVDVDQAEGIAQYVVLMALRHARSLSRYEVQQQQKQWVRHPVSAVRSRVSVLAWARWAARSRACSARWVLR